MTRTAILMSSFLFLAHAQAADNFFAGHFDNKAQIGSASADKSIPHVIVDIESSPKPDWTLWRVRVETESDGAFEQTWAMLEERQDHHAALVPYYQLKQDAAPDAKSFDPGQWLSLEACALRGGFGPKHLVGFAEGEPCVAVSMNVGARRALLPVSFETDGNVLHVDLDLRGKRTSIVADR